MLVKLTPGRSLTLNKKYFMAFLCSLVSHPATQTCQFWKIDLEILGCQPTTSIACLTLKVPFELSIAYVSGIIQVTQNWCAVHQSKYDIYT